MGRNKESKTQKYIAHIDGSMNIEGMPLTDEDKEMLRRCLDGETTFDEERDKLRNEIDEYFGRNKNHTPDDLRTFKKN